MLVLQEKRHHLQGGVSFTYQFPKVGTGAADTTVMSDQRKAGRPKKAARLVAEGAPANAQVKERVCLACRKKFVSEGPHNRQCLDCYDNYKGLEFGRILT